MTEEEFREIVLERLANIEALLATVAETKSMEYEATAAYLQGILQLITAEVGIKIPEISTQQEYKEIYEANRRRIGREISEPTGHRSNDAEQRDSPETKEPLPFLSIKSEQ